MPDRSLRLAVAQPACRALDVAANAVAHAELVRPGARVVVFPELSLTGYELAAPAVGPADERLDPLVAACRAAGAVALAGAPVAARDGRRHIAVLAIDGDGARVAYRKLHLGTAELAAGFVPGDGPAVVTVDGWRLGLAVCRDTGIAEHAATTAALGVDVYVAGVCHTATEATLHAGRARRTVADHGCWAATASFAGPTGGGYDTTAGRSGIWAPDGQELAAAGPVAGEVVVATLE